MNPVAIAVFVAFDIAITVAVVLFVLRRRGALGMDFQKLRDYTAFCERTIDEDFRATWSGDSSTLPAAIESLLRKLETEARAQSLPVERTWLKTTVARWLQSKHIASGSILREAMKQVA